MPTEGSCACQVGSSNNGAWPRAGLLTDPTGDLEMGAVTVEIRVRAGGPITPPPPGTCTGTAAVAAAAAAAAGAPLSPGKALAALMASGFGGGGRTWPLAVSDAAEEPADCQPGEAPGAATAGMAQPDKQQQQQEEEQQHQQQQPRAPSRVQPRPDTVDPDDGLCTICCDRPATCVFMECGHGGYCWRCAHLLYIRPPNECPVCRARIELVLEVSNPAVPLGTSAPVLQQGSAASGRPGGASLLGCLPCSGRAQPLPS